MEVQYLGEASPERWLTGAQQVETHLLLPAHRGLDASLTSPIGTMLGRLLETTPSRLLPFRPHPAYGPLPPHPPGTALRMDYEARGQTYTFHTRMMAPRADGAWLLRLPKGVQCAERRLFQRHSVMGDPAFSLSLEGTWEPAGRRSFGLLDISTMGLGFVFDPRVTPMSRHEVLSGRLGLPGDEQREILVRVTNIRPLGHGLMRRIAGGTFINMPPETRRDIALTVSAWEHRPPGGEEA